MKLVLSTLFLIAVALGGCAQKQAFESQPPENLPDPGSSHFTILSGTPGGTYFAQAEEICSRYHGTNELRTPLCLNASTAKYSEKVFRLKNQEVDFILDTSARRELRRINQESDAERSSPVQLRAVASFEAQPLTILVKRSSGIVTLDDLSQARVTLQQKSLAEALFSVLLTAKAWDYSSFKSVLLKRKSSEAINAFCDGTADAYVSSVGHPSGFTKELIEDCDGMLLPVVGPAVSAKIDSFPSISNAVIPAGTYARQGNDVNSFGFRTLLMTRSDVPDQLITAILQGVFDDLDRVRRSHPALATLEASQMASSSILAPLHPAAEAFYRDRGLLP